MKHPTFNKHHAVARSGALAVAVALSLPAGAAPWEWHPSVEAGYLFDDNYRLSTPNNEIDVQGPLLDAELELRELTPSTAREVLSLGPFGYGNPAPCLAVRGATLREPPSIMKEKHLKFFLQKDRFPLLCKAWNWVERLEEFPEDSQTLVDAVFALEDDSYSGFSATLRDLRRVSGLEKALVAP